MINGVPLKPTTNTKCSNFRTNTRAVREVDYAKLTQSNIPESQSVRQHVVADNSIPESTKFNNPQSVQTHTTLLTSDSESLFSVGVTSRSSLRLDSFATDSDDIFSEADSEVNKGNS